MFGNAQGNWGLAYKTNNAFQMRTSTWTHKYKIKRIETGKVCDLIAYFGELTEAGVVADKFAFYTKRSIINSATANPATDPLNQGFFIVGGGEEETELYTGGFTHVAVLHDIYYNTNLLSVQVGDQAAISAAGTARQFEPLELDRRQRHHSLIIDQPLFDKVLRPWRGSELPDDAEDLLAWGVRGRGPDPNQARGLARSKFTLQGASGSPATLTVPPGDYWQFDAGQKGVALANVFGDGGELEGVDPRPAAAQRILHCVRPTLGGGRGMISFAKRA